MINNIQWRTSFLATTAMGIGMVALYVLIEPTAGNRPVSSFEFPSQIPLNTWQQLDSKSLEISTQSSDLHNPERLESGHSYQYTKNDTKIAIEARYLVGSRGHVDSYISQYTQVDSQALKPEKIEYLKGIGYYRVFTFENRAYLSSCLNPVGNSTVTQKQFSQNLDNRHLNWELLTDWLLGKKSIRDRRCLWVTISTPNHSSSFLQPQDILEQVWQEWYQWWQPRFPEL